MGVARLEDGPWVAGVQRGDDGPVPDVRALEAAAVDRAPRAEQAPAADEARMGLGEDRVGGPSTIAPPKATWSGQ